MKALRRSTLTMLAVALVPALCACSTYHREYRLLSTRPLDLAGFDPEAAREDSRLARGVSEREIYFLLPDRDTFPTLSEAIDRTLEQGGGDLILNARVHRWHWYIPLMYGSSGWMVTGDVVDTGSVVAAARPALAAD